MKRTLVMTLCALTLVMGILIGLRSPAAASDQRRVLVDHGVVDLASLLVASIAGLKQRATQVRCQFLDRRFL